MKRYTLAEANALIPALSRRLDAAQTELDPLRLSVKEANESLLAREWRMRQARQDGAPPISMAELQADWDEAAADLYAICEHLAERETAWTRLFTRGGVLVRDLRKGTLDIPAEHNGHAVCFCWTRGESAIHYWHPVGAHDESDPRPLTGQA